jgi:hypothetical protein
MMRRHADPSLVPEAPERLQALGVQRRLELLSMVGDRFLSLSDPLRQEAEVRIPEEARLPLSAIRPLLDRVAQGWTRGSLETLLAQDFPDPAMLDRFCPGPSGRLERVIPPRLLVQYASGNVPGTGATALIRGLLVGAPTLLKPGSGDRVLPELLVRGLHETAPGLAGTCALLPWRGGQGGEEERACLKAADMVVVYGGEEAAQAVRERLSPLTPLRVYGPRISGGIVLRGGLADDDQVLEHAADAIVAYEQRGCVSPQVIWVEEGGRQSPREWAEALGRALEVRQAAGSVDGSVDRRMMYEVALFDAAHDPARAVFGGPEQGWMVLFEPRATQLAPTCLGRTVRVHGFEQTSEIIDAIRPMAPYLQTMALEGEGPDRLALADRLACAGVTRITRFREQPWPPAWWKEDGEGPLRTLVRWAVVEGD